ncbi:hypothetical protein DEIPH_ctg013orf0009 [Deinococcus phoenicis]|uniref:Uncharacterized protein n=1 Tax=Deinococcus phoenicis TaxID=1476583 RepID=A0A016QSM1_9DEIO|nr:hypothetical protein [Deinococcus phoenicis]EYB68907.1 hypothetical protein DEIPH_ctg013orf0009 [Deinococcus phoenicis]
MIRLALLCVLAYVAMFPIIDRLSPDASAWLRLACVADLVLFLLTLTALLTRLTHPTWRNP